MACHSWLFSAFRGFTVALIGFWLAAVSGSYNFMRFVLLTTAIYAVVGVIYGAWTTYYATVRAKLE